MLEPSVNTFPLPVRHFLMIIAGIWIAFFQECQQWSCEQDEHNATGARFLANVLKHKLAPALPSATPDVAHARPLKAADDDAPVTVATMGAAVAESAMHKSPRPTVRLP